MTKVSIGTVLTLVIIVGAVVPAAAAEGAKGQFLASVGLNMATSTNGLGDETGSEIGFSIEGAYNYPLSEAFSAEAGLMSWEIGGFDAFGVAASVLYAVDRNNNEIGFGIIPDGWRLFGRLPLNRGEENAKGPFGVLSLNFASKSEGSVSLESWAAVGVGYGF